MLSDQDEHSDSKREVLSEGEGLSKLTVDMTVRSCRLLYMLI